MDDIAEWAKMFGINGGTIGVVSLSDIELGLKVLLLALTCAWTAVKIVKLLKDDKE